ncbi:hypothetical protein ACGFIV_05485 [Sphaerisporangium sp. NPDC049003]
MTTNLANNGWYSVPLRRFAFTPLAKAQLDYAEARPAADIPD